MAKKNSQSTELTTRKAKLAEFAAQAAAVEQSSMTGSFFSLRGGILSFDGAPVPGNKMCVVILDHIIENTYFPDAFDQDVVVPPKCYAFGLEEQTLAPHELVVQNGLAQVDVAAGKKCSDCRHNMFGSAETGKGKACTNRRRLAIIPAGTMQNDKVTYFSKPEQFQSSLAFLKLPTTSIKDFSVYVKQLAGTLGVPPFGVYTQVSVVPDAKSQFKVQFQALQPISDELIDLMFTRRDEARAAIMSPYPIYSEEQAARPVQKNDTAGKKKKKGRKY